MNEDFDSLPGEVVETPDFDSLPGDVTDLNTGAVTLEGAAAPNMSVGKPAEPEPTFLDKAAELPGKVLTGIQKMGESHMGAILGMDKGEPGAVYGFMGKGQKPTEKPALLGPRLIAARAYKGLNPFMQVTVGERMLSSPEAEEGERQIQTTARDAMDSTLAPFSPRVREAAANTLSGLVQLGPELAGGFAPIVGGMSAAAKIAPKVTVLNTLFGPKVTSFVVGAIEAGVQMPVYGVMGAEKGDRAHAFKSLFTNPDPMALAFMALGGMGALVARNKGANREWVATQKKRGEYVKSLADETAGMQTEQEFVEFLRKRGAVPEAKFTGHKFDSIPTTKGPSKTLDLEGFVQEGANRNAARNVAAIISKDEMTKMADEVEARVSASSESAAAAPEPEAWTVLGKPQSKTQRQRDRRAGILGGKDVKELPNEIPSQAAIVESPTSKWGVRGVIEWTPTKRSVPLGSATLREPHGEPIIPGVRRQIVELNSYEDAKAFRKALEQSKHLKPEVVFSSKALEAMGQSQDHLMKDLLLYSAAELRAGKTSDGVMKNRNSALVIMDEVPYLASIKDPTVRARGARNIQVAAVNTKDGVRFAKLTISGGEHVLQPLDAKLDGLPTIKDGSSIPQEMFGRYVRPLTEDQLYALFAKNKVPDMKGVESLGDFAAEPTSTLTVQRRAPETSLLGKTRPGGAPAELSPAAAVADTPFGAAYAVEGGGHQGPAAGTGGTKKANIFKKDLPPPPPGGEGGGSGGGGRGGRPPGAPVAPEPVPAPDRPPSLADIPEGLADKAMAMEKLYTKANANWLQKVHRLLVGEHFRGGIDLQQQMGVVLAGKNVERVRGTLLAALEKAGKGHLGSKDFNKQLLEVFGGNKPASQVLSAPELAPMRRVLEDAMARRDFLHDELQKRGVIHPRDEMFTEAAYNKYVARTTMAYTLKPGEWLKIVEKDKAVWNRAKKFLMDQNPKLGPGDVDEMMRSMLNSKDSEGFFFSSPKTTSAAGHVKARKLMPPELKALFGQDQAGAAYTVAETLAVQERLYHTALIMDEFASNPLYARRDLPVEHVGEGSPYEGWTRLDGPRSQYGSLAQMYVHPALHDLLVEIPKMHEWGTKNLFSSALQELSSWSKGNETALGGVMPWANNILGGVQHMMMAGIAPWEVVKVGKKMGFAAQGLMDYRANPYANTSYVEFIRDAIRVGADIPGFGAQELVTSARNDLKAGFLEEVAGARDLSAVDRMMTGLRYLKKARGAIGNAFDVPDRLWRLSTFAQLTDRALAKGMNKEAALRTAARQVARAFPMPDRLGVLPDQARRYAGVLAPYLTYRTEVMRNYMMLLGTIMENPARMMTSLAGWGLVLYAGKKLYDYRDPMQAKLIEEEFARVPDNVAKYRPAMVATSFTGMDGRPVLMDLTPMFEVLRYTQGSGNPYLNVGVGMLGSIFEGGGRENQFRDIAGAGAPGFAQHERRRRVWETGWASMADMAWADWGMFPKAPIRAWGEWASTQPQPALPMGGPIPQDPKVAIGRALGMNFVRQPNTAAVGLDKIRTARGFIWGSKELGATPDDYPGRGLLQGFDKEEAKTKLQQNFQERMKK